jgi:hypothetical protein
MFTAQAPTPLTSMHALLRLDTFGSCHRTLSPPSPPVLQLDFHTSPTAMSTLDAILTQLPDTSLPEFGFLDAFFFYSESMPVRVSSFIGIAGAPEKVDQET